MNYDYEQRDNLEDAILGTIINYGDNQIEIKKMLFKHGIDDPNFFRTKFNQDVFITILKCWEQGFPADLLTVTNLRPSEYRSDGDLSFYNSFDINVITMTQKVATNAHFDFHLAILKQYVIIDFWNKKASDILDNFWDNRDALMVSDNIIDSYNVLLDKFTSDVKKSDNKDLKQKAIEKYERVQSGVVVSVPTGLSDYDRFSGGWQSPELSIIAARPSMGKTTVALAIAKNSCFSFKRKGLFISLEMTKQQLMNKVISSETGISYQDIKNYKISKEDFEKVKWWYDYFEDESNLKVADLTTTVTLSEIERDIIKFEPQFVVIDYLQLIKLDKATKKNNNSNREQEVAEIARTLKLFCGRYDIPIIALSQLSRGVDARPNKRPILSDLRESGAIEQDADNVIFIYRDAYYKEQRDGINNTIPEIEKGNFEFIVAKGRETGTAVFPNHINFSTFELSEGFKHNDNSAPLPPND